MNRGSRTFDYILGGLAAFVVFFGAWAYCVAEYGFLIGVSFGWFPSAICATLAFGLVRYLWPIFILVFIVGYIILR